MESVLQKNIFDNDITPQERSYLIQELRKHIVPLAFNRKLEKLLNRYGKDSSQVQMFLAKYYDNAESLNLLPIAFSADITTSAFYNID